MKKNFIKTTVVVACLGLIGCGTTGTGIGSLLGSRTSSGSTLGSSSISSSTALSAGSSILNNLLGTLLSSTITEKTLIGTWKYQSPECRFESENFLAQAGGAVVADNIEEKLESYLTRMGITKGVTSFTFKKDKTFSIQSNNRTITSGTYTFDSSTKSLTLSGSLGLLNHTCIVGMDGTSLCMLFDSTKLLTTVNTVGAVLGRSNSTLSSISALLGENYQGMKIGFKLAK
ncbi:MAG: DUF4923 family protein [Bacteroidaceae bacterium]|nr:DUF4923 family protein [Bacteroidaceae bacterium]